MHSAVRDIISAGSTSLLALRFMQPKKRCGMKRNAGSYAILYNLLGFPAGVAPVTRVQQGEETARGVGKDRIEEAARAVEMNSAGLPVGVQVAARPWREDIVLALLVALEEQTSVSLPICEDA